MDIAGLPTGSYKYVVAAKDESGLRLTLVNRNFEVVASQDSEIAIWPLSQVYITQGAYDSYSHQTENAFDCVVQPITGAKAFAPFLQFGHYLRFISHREHMILIPIRQKMPLTVLYSQLQGQKHLHRLMVVLLRQNRHGEQSGSRVIIR